MEKKQIESLADKYELPVDFVEKLFDKVIDKVNFERALRMFANGTLKYDVATGIEPFNVAEIRHTVAGNLWRIHEKHLADMERMKQIAEYYQGCRWVRHDTKDPKTHQIRAVDVVFVDDGRLVAFGRYMAKNGGIYAANNEFQPDFNWTPKKWLARLRTMNKMFYRQVKKAATVDIREHKEWFDFTNHGND